MSHQFPSIASLDLRLPPSPEPDWPSNLHAFATLVLIALFVALAVFI